MDVEEPQIIPRYKNEDKNPFGTLDWESTKKYKYINITSQGVKVLGNRDNDLSEDFFEVINTFCKILGAKYENVWTDWDISFHTSTPALQFQNNSKIQENQSVPLSSVFAGDLEHVYFDVSNDVSFVYKYAYRSLYKPFPWFQEHFSSYKRKKLMQAPKVEHKPPYVYVEDDAGYSARFAPKIYENYKENGTLYGTKEIPVMLLEDKDPIDNTYLDVDTGEVIYRTISTAKIISDSLEYLSMFYKIRLQVKPEYQIWTVLSLLKLFQGETGNYVNTFKCLIPYSRAFDENIGTIIIYVNQGEHLARKVLKVLVDFFEPYPYITLDVVPRFNMKITPVVYCSCGDGDFKKELQKAGVLDMYYEKETNYALLKNYAFV